MSTIDEVPAPARALRKDAARNRELLLAAAREVFGERGLDASLDDVARRAGVGVGTAYRHFANKYELAGAIFKQEVDEIAAIAADGLRHDDPWLGLVQFLESTLEAQTVNRGLREVLMGVHDAELEAEVHHLLAGPIIALVERAQAAGAVRLDAAPTDLGAMIMMLCVVADVAAEAEPRLWRRYLPILLAGLRPDGPALPVPPLADDVMRKAMSSHKQRLAQVTAQR
ncbi:helix-turn-helix domain-containing protein [Jatrophihabitans sp.]|uniref:TetR/AcrR family transcriptional regulator n=1 Tax=Jatrophihabitans sp. TaxID=1932789 RepID=UPI0030C72FD0|nr:TetR family transcriptional regulator [Jatrophihabitans sp.]